MNHLLAPLGFQVGDLVKLKGMPTVPHMRFRITGAERIPGGWKLLAINHLTGKPARLKPGEVQVIREAM